MTADSGNEIRRITYRLDFEYDGTDFRGWQIQPAERTVQECLQTAVRQLFGEPLSVVAAGRTDTGVHALGQVAHFRARKSRSPEVIRRALNAILPPDVRIRSAAVAKNDFHARYSAHWRAYRYRIACEPIAIGRAYCWCCYHPLRIEPMQDAARLVLGNHQFRSFAHENVLEKHYLSTVYRAEWLRNGPFLEFWIEANRFLHGMVRLLVGTFVGVGRGMIDAARITEILAAQDVRQAGPKAPACGLTLMAVGYSPWSVETRTLPEFAETSC